MSNADRPDGEKLSEDPRVTRTRELIDQAFYELLMEKSLHTLTIGEITDRARINRATFYAHYGDKYELYRHLVHSTFTQILKTNLDRVGGGKEARLCALVCAACTFFEELNSTCPPADRQTRPLVEVEVQQQLYCSVLDLIREDAEPHAKPLTTAEMIAKMASWAIWGACLDWEASHQSKDALAAQIYTVVVNMVSS